MSNEDGWAGRDGGSRVDSYRRRSPAPYGRRPQGGRNRSRSPVQIDRYQPGRDYAPPRRDEYRRRSPPPPNKNIDRYVPGQEPSVPLINPIANPLSLDCQVGFSYFAEWWRKDQEIKDEKERQKTGARRPPERLKGERESQEQREKEREKIQAAYDAYKEKLQAQMAKSFVHQHNQEEWFKERYDPEIREPFRQRQADFRRSTYAQWQNDLDNGAFDEFNLEGIYKNESNGIGGVVEKEEGETVAAAEVLGVGDLVPSKGAELKDDAALQPALLIKTIAPQVSRAKLEAFCKEHLGESDGGFRWLSLSDPNPLKKFHRIGWVMLNPGGDEEDVPMATNNDRGDGRDDEGDGEDGTKDDEDEKPNRTKQTAVDKALSSVNGKSIEDEAKGSFQCHVGIHVPAQAPRKKALWDLFSAPERVQRDLELAERLVSKLELELGENINGVGKIEERVEDLRSKGMLQPVNGSSESKKAPRILGEELEEGEDEDMGEEDEEGAYDEDNDDEDLLTKKKKLDLLVEYLRRVFNFCFFCVFEADSIHELARKCPGGHLRRPRGSLTTSAKAAAKASAFGEAFPLKKQEDGEEQENDEGGSPTLQKTQRFQKHNKVHQQLQRAFNWVKTYEDKLFQILEPDSADIIKLGGRPVDDALEDELKKYVKQEDEAKFRCKVPDCTKLFKGDSYWRKHVEKRHDEWFEKLKKELNEINLYVLDPAHITPSRSDASSNGHFATNNHMMTGTPRGFSLQGTFGMNGMAPGQFPAGFPQFPPGSWGQNGGGYGADGASVGPMRRGGGRFSSRTTGPYDRQPRDARGARWGAGPDQLRGGRTMPPRGFADGVGPAAVGPREATAGRSLKSYEDLDAVGSGGGGGESKQEEALDY